MMNGFKSTPGTTKLARAQTALKVQSRSIHNRKERQDLNFNSRPEAAEKQMKE